MSFGRSISMSMLLWFERYVDRITIQINIRPIILLGLGVISGTRFCHVYSRGENGGSVKTHNPVYGMV